VQNPRFPEQLPAATGRGGPTMDVEHINAVGNKLADLSHRTEELRGYL
jgi:hypothetical protein